MEKVISEQDIVNALCIYIANKKQIEPSAVEIELMYDDDTGFSAEAYALGRKQVLITANMIEALRYWVEHQLHLDPFAASIKLVLDDTEGIIAYVN